MEYFLKDMIVCLLFMVSPGTLLSFAAAITKKINKRYRYVIFRLKVKLLVHLLVLTPASATF